MELTQGEKTEISELPDDLAGAVAELGAPVATFKARGAALVVQMVLAPLLFFLGLAFVIVPIAFLIWGRMGGAAFKSFKLLILGVILLPGAFAMVRRAYRDWGLQVLVFADGLVRAQRDRVDAFFWDEIETVWRQKSQGAWGHLAKGTLVYTIRRARGDDVAFDSHLDGLKRLAELIEQSTLPYMLPRCQEAFEGGEVIDFAKLQISTAGLGNGQEMLPWSEIKEVAVGAQSVVIRKEGKMLSWHTAPRNEIPNFHVFLALVRPILGGRLAVAND